MLSPLELGGLRLKAQLRFLLCHFTDVTLTELYWEADDVIMGTSLVNDKALGKWEGFLWRCVH